MPEEKISRLNALLPEKKKRELKAFLALKGITIQEWLLDKVAQELRNAQAKQKGEKQ